MDGSITMTNNWDDWNGKSTTYCLTVDSIYFDKSINREAVALSGCGNLEGDTCCVNYYFSSSYGFYKWQYNWNNTQIFSMNLVQELNDYGYK
ncbi:hypothetical protein G3O08_11835 [Cryomorpha ignava]|uniref:Uncharacterized protein n=1 Tax=Cryomorpha ignava TaxID=101383 RepID=A0A7K3WR89_9FLAO|nr:hypothetical protein [Cryomorpha ignava]NEN24193.1 hypothetical protein [Cryomorpha ignava]